MSYKELEKVSTEDLALFFARLMDFYQETEDESYRLFRQDVVKSLRRLRRHDHDDLVDDVITRVILKNGEMVRRGEPILNFTAFAWKVAGYVVHEENRKMLGRPQSLTPDDQNPDGFQPREPRNQIADEIQKIEDEIKHQCFADCLDNHPEMRDLVLDFYPDEKLSWEELARRRSSVAEKVLGKPGKKNTLEVRIYRLRAKELDDCVKECTARRLSQHPELERLYQQQAGGKGIG